MRPWLAMIFFQSGAAGVLDEILAEDSWRGGPTWEDRTRILARSLNETIITDDNMATEWWAFGTYP